ncbi:MAG: sulfatase-like hydrolase/transferase [Gammaproteobacteria bacterium]|nr:sulfatase-like hydrolase/transferase [Gammaproteobacteria bacterium]
MPYSKDAAQPFKQKYLILFGLLLIIFFELFLNNSFGELSFLNPNNNTYTSVLHNNIVTNPVILLPFVYFILIQIFIHLVFVFYNYYYYQYILISFANLKNYLNHKFFNRKIINTELYTSKFNFSLFIILLIINYWLVLIINTLYFPNSKFAITNPYLFFSNKYIYSLAIVWLYLGVISCILYFLRKYKINNFLKLILLLGIFSGLLINNFKLSGAGSGLNINLANQTPKKINASPNVILLTIDSVRADALDKILPIDNQYFDLPKFFKTAVKFNQAYTPQARSFPALYSILSGHYPKTGNIRFNLVDQSQIDFPNLLPNVLKKAGYNTFYATDSSQFHIITKKWGYKYLAVPKPGIYEHIIPLINDLPLSNMLVNYRLSKYIFPYDYSNVAAKNTYEPSTYTNRIINSLDNINKLADNKPLYLHLNFESAHWPYQNRELNKNFPLKERYYSCLNTINQQINQIFEYLTKKNILNNSIVIVTSDHGESLSLSNDKLTNFKTYQGPKKYLNYINKSPVDYDFADLNKLDNKNILDSILDINTSGGHGVDVLSNSQYNVLTGLQRFDSSGKAIYSPQNNTTTIVLNDLYPTILDLLNINTPYSSEHLSLVPLFVFSPENSTAKFANRNIFLETDLQTPYYTAQELAKKEILTNFITTWSKYYHITKKQYLELRTDAIAELLPTKQYAVMNNQNILAYIPDGLKQTWQILQNTPIDTNACITPRVIQNQENLQIGVLCNSYKNSAGYYVYFNKQQNYWELFPSYAEFKHKSEITKLYLALKENYQDELRLLNAEK